jgi:carbon monoxide dehydrogenase subunit G
MDLTHRFTVPAPIDEAWAAFNDLERIAPCFPGAALTSYDGEEFAGLVKVKLGPISLQYTGTGRFVERDDSAHRAVVEAKGKDKRGNGTAAASITARLSEGADNTTDVEVVTALNITGKPAQFGRGVMQDVSDRLLGQFATCLETKLGPAADPEQQPLAEPEAALTQKSAAKEAPAKTATAKKAPAKKAAARKAAAVKKSPAARTPAEQAAAAEPRATSEAPAPGPPTTATAAHRREPEPVALNLGTAVIPVLARRYAPYLVGGFVGLVLLWRLVRRRR